MNQITIKVFKSVYSQESSNVHISMDEKILYDNVVTDGSPRRIYDNSGNNIGEFVCKAGKIRRIELCQNI